MKIEKNVLTLNNFKVNAFCFIPDKFIFTPTTIAIFTHGYTSHKGDVINWAHRVCSNGIYCIVFDLPGHYLGSFNEVSNFEDFTSSCHLLFLKAFNLVKNKINLPIIRIITGGHSLGAYFSLKALELVEFKNMEQVNLSVGTGYSPDRQNSFLESTFYENTINLRKELVSKTICPSKMLSWFKNRMNSLKLKNANILLLSGKDDLIAGREGPERLSKLLTEKGNFVTLNRPKKLPHHQPENATPFLYSYLKKLQFL